MLKHTFLFLARLITSHIILSCSSSLLAEMIKSFAIMFTFSISENVSVFLFCITSLAAVALPKHNINILIKVGHGDSTTASTYVSFRTIRQPRCRVFGKKSDMVVRRLPTVNTFSLVVKKSLWESV